ncbi:MAG: DUF6057 family protein, partial [Bacteroidales bacterium]|nr:DUF6057 family protein [Bacteroidales bacterium]
MRTNFVLSGIKWLLVVLFLGYLYLHFADIIRPELIYHLQQPPFYKMKTFFEQYVDYPGGLAEYFGNLLAQLLHANLSGSLLLVFSLLLFMLSTRYIFSKTSAGGDGMFWMIFPAIPAIILFQNYYFPYFVFLKILFALLVLVIFISLGRRKWSLVTILLLSIFILYYCAGATSMLIYLAGVILYVSFQSEVKWRFKLTLVVCSLILAIIIPYAGYKWFFNIPIEKVWWDLVPAMPVVIRYVPDEFLYTLISIVPIIMLLLGTAGILSPYFLKITLLNKLKNFLVRFRLIMSLFLILLVSAGTFALIKNFVFSKLNTQKRSTLLTDYYTLRGEWDKALEAALSAKEYDLFINYNYNRAVFNAGKLGENFFKYPQLLGADGLFPDKIASGQIALAASDFYYELGYVSEALHWAYEAQSTTPYNPRVLQRLVKVHLIERRTEAASTYLGILQKAFFQSDFVQKYSAYLKDTSLIGKDPEFIEKRKLMPLNAYTPGNINQKLKLLLEANPGNRRALEFLAMYYLL